MFSGRICVVGLMCPLFWVKRCGGPSTILRICVRLGDLLRVGQGALSSVLVHIAVIHRYVYVFLPVWEMRRLVEVKRCDDTFTYYAWKSNTGVFTDRL